LTRLEQLLLESARDVADIFDTPRQIRPESGQRPPQRGRVANRRGRYGLLAQFASAAVDRNARVRSLMRVNADNNHDPSLPRVALSAMHTTVRHLAPAWPCIVSRPATPTVSARRQVCGWTAADLRRRSDRQPRQLVSVSHPATRYTANLSAAVILQAKSEIKTFVNVSQSLFAPGHSQTAGIRDTRGWGGIRPKKIKNAAPLARSRTR
jgi:hypothetical protein